MFKDSRNFRLLDVDRKYNCVTEFRKIDFGLFRRNLNPRRFDLGEQQTGKTLVALTALEQVGLIAAVEHGGAKFWELVPTAGKKNLADAPILKCLEGE